MKKGTFPLISTISAHFRALILSDLQVYANKVSLSAKLHWSTLVNQRFCKFSMKNEAPRAKIGMISFEFFSKCIALHIVFHLNAKSINV